MKITLGDITHLFIHLIINSNNKLFSIAYHMILLY